MSQNSQNRQPDPAISVLVRDYPHGHRIGWHRHEADQLLYAASGTMSVSSDAGSWVIPPQRGVWIAAGVRHRIDMSGQVSMRTLYFAAARSESEPGQCRVLGIAALDRELILELVRTPQSKRGAQWHALARVLLDRLTSLPVMPLHLPMPQDVRARRAAETLANDAAGKHTLSSLARQVGASERTLARLFVKETGLCFGQWQQQCRLLAALPLLASGQPVTSVAMDVGYRSPSAFIAMFRRALGVPPGRYFLAPEKGARPDGA